MVGIFAEEVLSFIVGDDRFFGDDFGSDRLLPSNDSNSNFYSNLPWIGIDTWQGENILNSEYEVTENLSSFEEESYGEIDILIGSNVDATSVVENALPMVQDLLQNFSSKADFEEEMNLAFGDSYDVGKADVLVDSWQDENLGFLPEIKIVSEDEINGAKGAFAGEIETIYLAEEFVWENVGDVGAIAHVIVEEFGHYIDGEINSFDTPGDEGEIFVDLVRGVELSADEFLRMKQEDDEATVLLNGDTVSIEQANVSWIGGSGDWYNSRNWSGGKVPKSSDNVTVETFGKNIKINFSKGNPNIRDLFLGAKDGGSLTLNGLTTVGNDTDILAEGKNSVVKLPALKTFSGKDVFQHSSITVRDGGKIEANKLATMTQVDLYADNSNLQLPAVNNFTGIDDTVVKATNKGKLTLGAKTISGDVDITATGKGSVVNLSRATDFNGKDVFQHSFIKAENNGTVKANKLKSIKQVDLYADNSNLQLPALNNFTGIDDTVVKATNKGKLTLGAKTISGDVDITATGEGSVVNLPKLTRFLGKDVFGPSSLITKNGGKVNANKLTTVTNVDPFDIAITSEPNITISDTTVTEGNKGRKNAKFTVTLDSESDETVKVNYATANDTAKAGKDYRKTNGTLTFKPGQTKKTITVPILGDTLDESNEQFNVNLSKPRNAKLGDKRGVATIRDNDDPTPNSNVLTGGKGRDILTGSADSDVFFLTPETKKKAQADRITNFDNEKDFIILGNQLTADEVKLENIKDGTLIKAKKGGKILGIVEDVKPSDLTYSFISGDKPNDIGKFVTFEEPTAKTLGNGNVKLELKGSDGGKFVTTLSEETGIQEVRYVANSTSNFSRSFTFNLNSDGSQIKLKIDGDKNQWKLKRKNNDEIDISLNNEVFMTVPDLPNDDGSDSPDYDLFDPLDPCKVFKQICETVEQISSVMSWIPPLVGGTPLTAIQMGLEFTEYICLLVLGDDQDLADTLLSKTLSSVIDKVFENIDTSNAIEKSFMGNNLNQFLNMDLNSSLPPVNNRGIMKTLRKKLGIDWCDEDTSKKVEVTVNFTPFGNPWAISELYLASPNRKYIGTAPNNIAGLNNDAGKTVSLGKFPVGTELKFETDVIMYDDLDKTKQIDKFQLSSTNPSQAKLDQWWDGYGTLGFEDSYSGYFLTDVEFPDDFNDTEVYLSGANFSGNKIIVTE